MDSIIPVNALVALGQPRCEINPAAIKGERGTGFEKRGQRGPFECGNCEYFEAAAGACGQEDMIEHSKQPRLDVGRPSVAFDDCCEYIERMGKKDALDPAAS